MFPPELASGILQYTHLPILLEIEHPEARRFLLFAEKRCVGVKAGREGEVHIKYLLVPRELCLIKGLRGIYAALTWIARFPLLPKDLKWFNAFHNKITRVHLLPKSLEWFNIAYNKLIKLPPLPQGLKLIH